MHKSKLHDDDYKASLSYTHMASKKMKFQRDPCDVQALRRREHLFIPLFTVICSKATLSTQKKLSAATTQSPAADGVAPTGP